MSKVKKEISPLFEQNRTIQDFINRLPQEFEHGRSIYTARNIIKAFNIDEFEVIVKRYKKANFVQSIIYSFFRKSKARRAFYNAIELRKREVKTPLEIAFIEQWEKGLFQYGYYISDSDNAPPIREKLIEPKIFDTIIAQDFARFVAELHQKGILHHDLNSTNVLYHNCEDGHYNFSLIDINRMTFYSNGKQPSRKECFENLTRFTGRMDLFEYVIRHYAQSRNWDITETVIEAILIKNHHDEQWQKRKAFLRKFKRKD